MSVWQRINERAWKVGRSATDLVAVHRFNEPSCEGQNTGAQRKGVWDTHTKIKNYQKNRHRFRYHISFDIPEGLIPDVP